MYLDERHQRHPVSRRRGAATLRLGLGAALLILPAATVQAQTAPPSTSASTTAPTGADPVLAQRGAVTLTASQVRTMIAYADPQLRQQLQANPAALDTLVRDRVLQMAVLAEAHDHHWDTRPDVVWRAQQAHDAAIAQSYIASLTQPDPAFPSEAQIQAAYDANKGRLVMPRQYHLAQIYLAVPPGAPASADAAAQKRLADLRGQVAHGHADFAALARRLSDDHASASNGGDLGWLREDQVLAAVRSVVAGLPEGGVSEPVHAGDGWHLVRLLGTRPPAPATLAQVHEALARALRQRQAQQNAQAYIDGLLRQQPLQLDEIKLSNLAKP